MTVDPPHLAAARDRGGDVITHEELTGKLLATVDEMAIVLARASMSPVVSNRSQI